MMMRMSALLIAIVLAGTYTTEVSANDKADGGNKIVASLDQDVPSDFEAPQDVPDVPSDFEAPQDVPDVPSDFEAPQDAPADIPNAPPATSKDSSWKIPAIIGGIVGGLVVLGIVVFFLKRKSSRTGEEGALLFDEETPNNNTAINNELRRSVYDDKQGTHTVTDTLAE